MARRRPDPMSDYQGALATLKRDGAAPICVVSGGQDWFRRTAIQAYEAAIRQAYPDVSEISFQGPASQGETTLPVTTVLEELTSYGLFASNKLVVVRRAQRFLFPVKRGGGDNDDDKGNKKHAALIRYLENPTDGMFLLLELDSLDKRTKLGKTLNKAALVIPCPELKYERDTLPWLRAEAKRQGVGLTPQAAEMLFSIHGADPGVLASELTKLSLYAEGTGQIDGPTVESFMGGTMALSFFELGNAVEAGNTHKALNVARRMIVQGVQDSRGKRVDLVGTVHMALGSLRSTLSTLWEAHDVASQGGSEQDLRAKLGARGWRAPELLAAGRRMHLRDIEDGFECLAAGLAALHDTGGDPAITLERAVHTLCRRR
ncbi:MAG: DNA polymerase III subunit delta [Planctomycetota bacterium]